MLHVCCYSYERLPLELRQQMTRAEYERQEVRSADDEDEDGEGGLLPVVVFCFSKKKCEEIVDFFKGQDLLAARAKGEVRKVMAKVRAPPTAARPTTIH